AGDVYSHNHFVPVQMVVSYQSRTARHVYWEARFDAAQARDRWRLMSTVFDHRYPDCDRLVERVVERTLFSFKTNKRIFSSVMAVQRRGHGERLVETAGVEQAHRVGVGAEARAGRGHVVGDDEIEVLGAELPPRFGRHLAGLGREADQEPPSLARAEPGQDVRGALELEREPGGVPLELARVRLARPVVGDGGGHDHDRGAREGLLDRGRHLA